MNTLTSPAAAQSATRPTSCARLSRTFAALAFALAAPLLAACSSDGDAAGNDPTGSASSPAGGDASTSTPFATPTAAAKGDPFCDIAVAAQEDALANAVTLGEFDTVMNGIATGTSPVSDLNAWGTALSDLATRSIQFYDDAVPYVEGTAAESDFSTSRTFVSEYSLPLGTMAATATDANTFLEQMATFVTTPGAQTAMTTGPAAAEGVSAYITERCPADA